MTSSKGVTTTDSVAPAKHPVRIARDWVLLRWPEEVKRSPHHPGVVSSRGRVEKYAGVAEGGERGREWGRLGD